MYFDSTKMIIYICGGSGQNFKVLDDLYQYNISKNLWAKITSRICIKYYFNIIFYILKKVIKCFI